MKGKKTAEEEPMAIHIDVKASLELRNAIGAEADLEGIPMNEWIARTLAEKLGRPELAKIPRKRMGRPRKVLQATQ